MSIVEGLQMLVAISDTASPLIIHLADAARDLHVKATLFPTLQHILHVNLFTT